MEELFNKSIPELISNIYKVLESKYLKNEYLNEWYEKQLKIIDRDVTETYFQDSRYIDLHIDEFMTEANEETDKITYEIEDTVSRILFIVQDKESSNLCDTPGFEAPYAKIMAAIRLITKFISVRNSDKIPSKCFYIEELMESKLYAINTLKYTYGKDHIPFISKHSGVYARSSEYLKNYIANVVKLMQTTRTDLRDIIPNLQIIRNTYNSYKKYFNGREINNFY